MKNSLFGLLVLLACGWTAAFAAPDAGVYAGTVTITKGLQAEGLESTYTLKAKARVGTDGTITILTDIPEGPAAAMSVDNSVTRVVPIPVYLHTAVLTDAPPDPLAGFSYAVDSKYGANVSADKKALFINYQSAEPVPVTVAPGTYLLQMPPKYTVVSFKLLKKK